MTLQTFFSKINWRLMLLHGIAFWFFSYAFETLANLHFVKMIGVIRQTSNESISAAMQENDVLTTQIVDYFLWNSFASLSGLLVAFFISLGITIKKGWFWINSIITLLLFLILSRFGPPIWIYTNGVLLYPGKLFENLFLEFLINGMLLLCGGCFLFFFPYTNRITEVKSVGS